MLKFYLNKTKNISAIKSIQNFYENWIIPPHNELLLELKKREFKERTKYLDPKIFYTLSQDEKNGKYIRILIFYKIH